MNISISIIFFLILIPLILGIPIMIAVYVYRDASKRDMNAILWMLIALLTPSLLGLIIYLLVRNNYSDLKCPKCDTRVEESFVICPTCRTKLRPTCPTCAAPVQPAWQVCPHCGTPLEFTEEVVTPIRKKDKTLGKILIAILVIPIILILLMVVAASAFTISNTSSYSTGFSAVPVEEYLKECEHREVLEEFFFSDVDSTAYKVMEINDDTQLPNEREYLIYIPGASGYIDHTVEIEAKGWFSDDYYLELDILCNGHDTEELIFEFTYQTTECPDDLKVLFNGQENDIYWSNFTRIH